MLNSRIKCNFCNGPHHCKDCDIEKKISPQIKKIIGRKMEFFIAENLTCPYCYNKGLSVLDDNTPSLDIICNCCGKYYEVKSKCLSSENIPNNLYLSHGNYNYYLNRQEEELDFMVIIYKVDRKTKTIMIRKVFHVSDNDIRNSNNFVVIPNNDNNYCKIIIKNHIHFQENKKIRRFKIHMSKEIDNLFKDNLI
jgi:hypothetical protein